MACSLFSKAKEEHLSHLQIIFKKINDEKLMINLEKCEFMKIELVYLGFLLSQGNLKMDPIKVEAILN